MSRPEPTPEEIDAAWTAHVTRQHPVLLEFLRACRGTGTPGEPTPLDALEAVIESAKEAWPAGSALAEEIDTVERLARELRAAVARAEGGDA